MARDELFKCACGESFWRREGLEYHLANNLCGTSAVMAEIAQVEGQNVSCPVASCGDDHPWQSSSISRANPIASQICHDAEELISGARATTHGSVETTHANIAGAWNAILRAKWHFVGHNLDGQPPPRLDSLDILNMLEALKIMRRYGGSFNLDDFIDGVGYAALAGQVAAEKARER